MHAPRPLLQFANENAGELNRISVMLQRDPPASGDARQLSVVHDRLAIQHDGQTVAQHRDDEAVPLADRFVRANLRRDRFANGGRQRLINAVAAHFAGAEKFPDGLFSVQKVEEGAISLGFFSYARYSRAA